MKQRKIYPAIFRWAYASGKEEELITPKQQESIPKQTKSNWRNLPASEIRYLEEELDIRNKLEHLIIKGDLDWYRKRKLFIKISRLHKKTIELLGTERYYRLLSCKKEEFVKLNEDYSKYFRKTDLLEWFQVSSSRYQLWHTAVMFECNSSKLKLCAKKHPYQITGKEYKMIETYLLDPAFSAWPKSAIHSELLKTGKLNISRSTFYKHAKNISPSIERKKIRKPSYNPIRAHFVNEYWHMDISYFRTENGQRSYIYAIIDNYSRKIITWRCETKISKVVVGDMISEALQSISPIKLNLISDGGSENVNYFIKNVLVQFHEQIQADVNHLIALKTIIQSNSMIERFFRLMKYNYLYIDVPESHEELCILLKRIINEYNFLRPHYALKHLTPDEVYRGVAFPNTKAQLYKARKRRLKLNKNCNCTVCTCN